MTTPTDTDAAQRAALDKSTLDHPPIAAFVDLVYLIEDGAPAECIRDAVGELRRHGYIVSPPPPCHPAGATRILGTIAPRSVAAAHPALLAGRDSAVYQRENLTTLAGHEVSVSPSPASRSARPASGNTPRQS